MKIIAHRGYHEYTKENSMDSFFEAFQEKNIDGIEFDVRKTKDHHFVIYHNILIKRFGFVKEKTLKELKTYNLGTKETPIKIPTLEEVLKNSPKDKLLLIELKEEGKYEKKDTQNLFSLLNKYKKKHFLIFSFNRKLIDTLKEKSSYSFGLCISEVINRKYLNQNYDFQVVHHNLTEEVDPMKKTFLWTVNQKGTYSYSIITDKPSLFFEKKHFQ